MRKLAALGIGLSAFWWLWGKRKADAPAVAASTGEPVPLVGPDDLTQIKGVGPKLAEKLQARGITSFAQIAGWSEADIAALDEDMLSLKGRIERDDWVGQAKVLAAG